MGGVPPEPFVRLGQECLVRSIGHKSRVLQFGSGKLCWRSLPVGWLLIILLLISISILSSLGYECAY